MQVWIRVRVRARVRARARVRVRVRGRGRDMKPPTNCPTYCPETLKGAVLRNETRRLAVTNPHRLFSRCND